MVYYPYFRGKQFELIAIRESATLLAESNFVPIIEPVRESLAGLARTLSSVRDAGGRAIVVTNPRYGDHRESGEGILDFLDEFYPHDDAITAGVLLREDTDPEAAAAELNADSGRAPSLIHAGFPDPAAIAQLGPTRRATNIFIDGDANMLYRRHFRSSERILIRDGFERMRNSDYKDKPVQPFSDLHVLYPELGMSGFGDFLTVGDSYSEGGGPAYAVAIHLTYVDPGRDDAMFVRHFVSDTNDTPTDPAGKFLQALSKLIAHLDSAESRFYQTAAITEFRALFDREHFPGLGFVKKLSMTHHIETLSIYQSQSIG